MTTQLEQAARQALEALEMWCPMTATYLNTRDNAITALRAALEQPAQQWTDETAQVPDHVWEQPAQDEPVAWLRDPAHFPEEDSLVPHVSWKRERLNTLPLYTRPQAREPQPCPYVVSTREGTHHCSLSQREPLTDEQKRELLLQRLRPESISVSLQAWYLLGLDDAEAAHGIKGKA